MPSDEGGESVKRVKKEKIQERNNLSDLDPSRQGFIRILVKALLQDYPIETAEEEREKITDMALRIEWGTIMMSTIFIRFVYEAQGHSEPAIQGRQSTIAIYTKEGGEHWS